MIPIGIDQSELRRAPVVSFTLMGLWLALQVIANMGGSKTALERDYIDLVNTYRDARYLEMNAFHRTTLEALLFFDTVRQFDARDYVETLSPVQRSAYLAALAEYGSAAVPPVPVPEVSDSEKDRASRAFALKANLFLRYYPEYRFGIGAQGTSAFNLLTYFWIHSHVIWLFLHLGMFFFTAPLVEDRFGRRFFVAFLGAAALFTGIMLLLFHRNPFYTVVGAGGIVAAVCGAFLLKFYDARFTFFYATRLGSGTFKLPAYFVLVGQFLLIAWFTYKTRGYGGGTSWLYLWGFLFGFATALTLKLTGWDVRLDPRGIDLDAPENSPIEAVRLADAGGDGNPLDILAKGIVDYPEMEDLRRRYWSRAREEKDPKHLAEAAPWMFDNALQNEDIGTALIVYRTCRDLVPHLRFPFDECCFLAGTLIENGDVEFAGEVIDRQKALLFEYSPQQRLQLALLAAEWRHDRALEIAKPLEDADGLDAEGRETLAAALAHWRQNPDFVHAEAGGERTPIALADYQRPMVLDRQEWGGEAAPSPPWEPKSNALDLAVVSDHTQPPPSTEPAKTAATAPQKQAAPAKAKPTLFHATVRSMDAAGLDLEIKGMAVKTFPFQRINGLALCLVAGRGLILDLVFGNPSDAGAVLRVIRLVPDEEVGRRLFPDVRDARTALVLLARTIHQKSSAALLLGEASLKGPDLVRFPSMEAMAQRCYPGRTLKEP